MKLIKDYVMGFNADTQEPEFIEVEGRNFELDRISILIVKTFGYWSAYERSTGIYIINAPTLHELERELYKNSQRIKKAMSNDKIIPLQKRKEKYTNQFIMEV